MGRRNRARDENPFSFSSGIVQSRNVGRVIGQIDKLVETGEPECEILKWENSQWSSFSLEWTATRMWVVIKPELRVFITGPAGNVLVLTVSGSTEEQIDASANGPRGRGHIRDLRGIEDHLYVCGMGRQVYRRAGPGQWERHDQGVVLPVGDMRIAGFNSIDGTGENDMYAVGYQGEIWHYSKGVWNQIESPTNVILHRVRVVDSKTVYVGGQGGVLIRGRGDIWRELDHGATKDNLWGMEWFRGHLYVSTDNEVFRLGRNDQLEKVSEGLEFCGHLHANDGVMWSFGTKQIAWTEDGVTWHDVTPGT